MSRRKKPQVEADSEDNNLQMEESDSTDVASEVKLKLEKQATPPSSAQADSSSNASVTVSETGAAATKVDVKTEKEEEGEHDSEQDDPTGLEGAAFQSRLPFDKMTAAEASSFPEVSTDKPCSVKTFIHIRNRMFIKTQAMDDSPPNEEFEGSEDPLFVGDDSSNTSQESSVEQQEAPRYTHTFQKGAIKTEQPKLQLIENLDDSNLNFFKSLLPHMKALKPVQNLRLRIKITNLIIEELAKDV